MESNCVQGKIFVGGISSETSEEVLTQHFSRYGEVVKSQVIKYRDTNCGKGFGFVTFADASLIEQLIHQQHIILGRTVDVKLAIPKGASGQCQLGSECPNFQRQDSDNNRRKIFVGGLPLNLSEEEFKTYFEKFGTISQVNLISDKETKTPRGFGFVTYDSEESVTHALQEKLHWLINKYVEVKKAEPRERRVIHSNYHNFYPGYGMWQIYDCNNEIFAPQYCHNHTMVPTNWTSSFNHLGTNQFVHPQPIVPYFTPTYPVNYYGSTHRYPINCYCSTHNQVDHNRGSYSTFAQNNVINEENDQECNNTEVQLVGDGSLPANESAKSLEKETDNGGEKDDLKKILHDNTKENNDEIDHLVKILQINSEDDTQSTEN